MIEKQQLKRLLAAATNHNVPGVVGGGGILASIFTRNCVSIELELVGAAIGMALAFWFVVHTNLKYENGNIAMEKSL